MNSDGSLAARYDYDPYGKRLPQFQASAYSGGCDFGFTGHITQQSAVSGQGELVLTFFRGYDPEIGKWLSPDPIGENGGMNLYGYVGGNSVNYLDFFGLEPNCNFTPDPVFPDGRRAQGSSRDSYLKYAKSIVPKPGEFHLLAHGLTFGIYDDTVIQPPHLRKMVTAPELIDYLQKNYPEAWGNAKEVWLHSCSTGQGANSFGEQVAKLSGKIVHAPTDILTTSGSINNGGGWRRFPEVPKLEGK